MNINNQHAIGIFDSGVGGLSILNAVRRRLPQEDLIYIADTKNAPYGERTSEFIESRVKSIAAFLAHQQVKLMVVACNTATAAAVKSLRETYQIPIVGLEPALKPAIEASQNKNVGVLATRATLNSDKYQTLRSRFENIAHITEKASSYFVQLVETSANISTQEFARIETELQPFIQAKVDSLVLGCSHFPFLAEPIQRVMGDSVRLFDSGLPVAKEVERRLENNFNPNQQTGTTTFYSSDPDRAQPVFNLLLDDKVEIRQLNV